MNAAFECGRVQPAAQSVVNTKRLKHGIGAPCKTNAQLPQRQRLARSQRWHAAARAADGVVLDTPVKPEADVQGMSAWLDRLKWDAGGLVAVIAQVQHLSSPQAILIVFCVTGLGAMSRVLNGTLCSVAH